MALFKSYSRMLKNCWKKSEQYFIYTWNVHKFDAWGGSNGMVWPPPQAIFWQLIIIWDITNIYMICVYFKRMLGQNLSGGTVRLIDFEQQPNLQKFFSKNRQITGYHRASQKSHLWVLLVKIHNCKRTILGE